MKPDIFLEHFELLAESPNGVPKLRKLILQLAVQGKLVPQDPNDEPISKTLFRIGTRKKLLAKEEKIKELKEKFYKRRIEFAGYNPKRLAMDYLS